MRRDNPRLPADALDDDFAPPAASRPVRCLHCGRVYDSALMEWDTLSESWGCPMPGCDGGGYGIDVHDVNAFDGPRD